MFSAFKKRLDLLELLRHSRRSEDDLEPRTLLGRRALAHELDNYNQDRFPFARYDVNMDQKFQVGAFKAALRAVSEEDDPNFNFQLDPEHPDAEEDTLVFTDSEESDLTTLDELDNIETMKPVDLFSLEDIFSDPYETIPALLIRYTDIIGSDRLAYQHDAAIYYDFCVDQIERHVSSRGVMAIPRVPDHEFFHNHAVRVFLQVPDIPDILDGPFYRYMGDCYIVKTNRLLPQHEWDALPEYIKEGFVRRFVETHNSPPKDSYRAQNCYTSAPAKELLDKGNTYPLIILKQAYQQEEPLEPYSPIRLNGTELLFFPPTSPNSDDLVSVYSQERARNGNEEPGLFFYSSAANLDNFPSPLFTDPFSGNVIITLPSEAQEIYPASRPAFAYDGEDYGVDEGRKSVWSDGENGDPNDNYNDNNSDEEDDDNADEDDCKVQNYGSPRDQVIEKRSCWFDDGEEVETDEVDEDGAADTKHSGNQIQVSEEKRAIYAAVKALCEDMEETSRAETPMGRAQRKFIQNMHAEMVALGLE